MIKKKTFKSSKEVTEKAEAYFVNCDAKGKPYAVSGLAFTLGISRSELLAHPQEGVIGLAIKKALARCELSAEEHLLNGKNVSGVIFSLKSNWGWKDKPDQAEQNHSDTKLSFTVNVLPPSVNYDEDEEDDD